MNWLDKILPSLVAVRRRKRVPQGLWVSCPKCNTSLYKLELEENLNVCAKCDYHFRISARKRLDIFLDQEEREELFADMEPVDQLNFKDSARYRDRLRKAQQKTGEKDALVAMRGTLHGLPVVALAFEFDFHGGSMGYVVGDKFAQAATLCMRERIALVCFAASGGARMQEALISLMQLAKTSATLDRMKQEGVPYISVLTDPVYGGVSASLATLGDINIAEPGVRAGFAGPNIIRDTMRLQHLPEGFQSSEFLLKHGAIDYIVSRCEIRNNIARVLAQLTKREPVIHA